MPKRMLLAALSAEVAVTVMPRNSSSLLTRLTRWLIHLLQSIFCRVSMVSSGISCTTKG